MRPPRARSLVTGLVLLAALFSMISACGTSPPKPEPLMSLDDLTEGPARITAHRGGDDLLSAGLGLAGLAGAPEPFVDPSHPTAAELRRRAIQLSWRGIADLGPLGGYGMLYGGAPDVPGRELQAFARLPGRHAPHRVLLQLPDAFDARRRCLVVAPSSGSRGVYGAIALAGAWALPRGCAVVYTDKGTGTGYFDYADDSGVALDGRRARRGTASLEFEPPAAPADAGIAVKHLHSGDNPEADWGHHVLQAAKIGLAMLGRALPEQAPFTPQNTRIIATGLSNGGGAVLQAAGLDHEQMLAGVVALEPNVFARGAGRPLYDYATEAAIWLPCALTAPRFAQVPFARDASGQPPAAWRQRCASLQRQGSLPGVAPTQRGEAAYQQLRAAGWDEAAMATAASTTAFDLWRAVSVGYASAFLRQGATNMPCGFRYAAGGGAYAAIRAGWWANGSGIPPGDGIALLGGIDDSDDPTLAGLECLRSLWTADGAQARALHAAVDATAVALPRAELPLWVVHGADDGLVPTAFSSQPYIAWLREHGRRPLYWKVPHAQHFDAFLTLPDFGARHVPLLPYGYAALDRLFAHLFAGQRWPDVAPTPQPSPRGTGPLTSAALSLPAAPADPIR